MIACIAASGKPRKAELELWGRTAEIMTVSRSPASADKAISKPNVVPYRRGRSICILPKLKQDCIHMRTDMYVNMIYFRVFPYLQL